MRRTGRNFVIVIAAFCLSLSNSAFGESEIQTAETRDIRVARPSTYSLLVGTDEYADKKLNLKNPVKDCNDLNNIFLERYGWHSKTLPNKSRPEILNEIRSLVNEPHQDDQLFIYFAGHGEFDESLNDGLIITKFSKRKEEDDLRDSCIKFSELSNLLDRSKFGKIVLVLDICYGGRFVDEKPKELFSTIAVETRNFADTDIYFNVPWQTVAQKVKERPLRRLIAAGRNPVYEGAPGAHSPLASNLIKLFNNEGFFRFNNLQQAAEATKPDGLAAKFSMRDDFLSDFLIIPMRTTQTRTSETPDLEPLGGPKTVSLSDIVLYTISKLPFEDKQDFVDTALQDHKSMLLSFGTDENSLRQTHTSLLPLKGLLIEDLRRTSLFERANTLSPELASLATTLQKNNSQMALLSLLPFRSPSLRKKLDELDNESESLERQFYQRGFDVADLLKRCTIRDFAATLKPDEVFIDIYRYLDINKSDKEPRYGTFVLTSDGNAKFLSLDGKTVDSEVRRLFSRWATSNTRSIDFYQREDRMRTEECLQTLNDLVWKPISKAIPSTVSKVWVSPDGRLARVPWDLLARFSESNKVIFTIDSPREYRGLAIRNDRTPTREALFVADISNSKFRSLPGTRYELDRLTAIKSEAGITSRKLTGNYATKERVLEDLQRVGIAHFATHSYFDSTQKSSLDKAGIIISETVTSNDESDGGKLSADELLRCDLRKCNLLSLSTGSPSVGEDGDDHYSLFRSVVLAAGAKCVLECLWQVDDSATAAFMSAFYHNLIVKGMRPYEALRSAQSELRMQPQWKDIYYWGGWNLIGEG